MRCLCRHAKRILSGGVHFDAICGSKTGQLGETYETNNTRGCQTMKTWQAIHRKRNYDSDHRNHNLWQHGGGI